MDDLQAVKPRQRVLRGSEQLDLTVDWFGQRHALPIALAPVGLMGMYARRGEVQAVRAAGRDDIPFIQSTVSVCPLAEGAAQASRPIWFQLYVLKDREFTRNVMRRARELGATTLVFTVDMPVADARYRDAHSGMSGPIAPMRRVVQAMTHPTLSVGRRLARTSTRPREHLGVSWTYDWAAGLYRVVGRKFRSWHQLAGSEVDTR